MNGRRYCAWCGLVLPLPKKNLRSTRVYCRPKCCDASSRMAHNAAADASPLRTDQARMVTAALARRRRRPITGGG